MGEHKRKKTKRSHEQAAEDSSAASFIAAHHPEKPSARAVEGAGRTWTVSVAVPASIVLNAQTPELRTHLAGQLARALAIFSVDEVVIFRDSRASATATGRSKQQSFTRGRYRDPDAVEGADGEDASGRDDEASAFLARILEYLETPQYLRKALFPLHPALRHAGVLPPLDCPHHLRRDEQSRFRDGIVVDTTKRGGVLVDVGHFEPVEVPDAAPPQGTRVTVRLGEPNALVSPRTPLTEAGLYWGYEVRVADSLAQVFSESSYEGGYDVTVGTSERGQDVEKALDDFPQFQHLLIALGPLAGLELCVASDPKIPLGAEEASDLFDFWLNVISGQGSRTVRTEEALIITLSRMRRAIEANGQR